MSGRLVAVVGQARAGQVRSAVAVALQGQARAAVAQAGIPASVLAVEAWHLVRTAAKAALAVLDSRRSFYL